MAFLNLFFILILAFVGSIALFYLVIHIIKQWTGCDNAEAEQKLHNFFNGKAHCSFNNDVEFQNDVWHNIRNIIGDKRFEQLRRLSQTSISPPLLVCGYNSGLPYIAITVNYTDDNEKRVLENVLTNLVKLYLQVYGYKTRVLTDWKIRYDLNMTYLEIRYATNREENRIVDIVFQNEQRIIVYQNSEITDDEDENDLEE